MNRFDKIVLYHICDFLYDEYRFNLTTNNSRGKRSVSYQTFRNLCKALSDKIINNLPFTKSERKILNNVLDRLSKFFGLTDDESVNYMYDFLNSNLWLNSYESISLVNTVFGTSKNI